MSVALFLPGGRVALRPRRSFAYFTGRDVLDFMPARLAEHKTGKRLNSPGATGQLIAQLFPSRDFSLFRYGSSRGSNPFLRRQISVMPSTTISRKDNAVYSFFRTIFNPFSEKLSRNLTQFFLISALYGSLLRTSTVSPLAFSRFQVLGVI